MGPNKFFMADPSQRVNMAANWAQFLDLVLLLRDASNNEILDSLNKQNSEFLSKIIEQNEKIIKLLEDLKDANIHV